MILTDIMISASTTICHLYSNSGLPVPSAANSANLCIKPPELYMGGYLQMRFGVSCCMRVYMEACSGVYSKASWEHCWKHTVYKARSVIEWNRENTGEHTVQCASERLQSLLGSTSSSRYTIRSVHGSILRSVHWNILGGIVGSELRMYLLFPWEPASKLPWHELSSVVSCWMQHDILYHTYIMWCIS